MTFTDTNVVKEAFKDRGQTEHPPGSNCTDITHEYVRLVGPLGNGCFSWCCASVIEWWHRAGGPLVPTAAVAQLMAYAKAGKYGLRFSTEPVIGAACLIGWDGPRTTNWNDMHTGITYAFKHRNDFDNIEGNYKDRVDIWHRDDKYVMGWAVPTFETDTSVPFIQLPPPNLRGLIVAAALASTGKETLQFRLTDDGHVVYTNVDKPGTWLPIPDGPAAGLDWGVQGKPIFDLAAEGKGDDIMVSVRTDKGLTMIVGKPSGRPGNSPGNNVWDVWTSLGKP